MKFSLRSIKHLEEEVASFTNKQSFISYVTSITKHWLEPAKPILNKLKSLAIHKHKTHKIILKLYARAGYDSVHTVNGLGEAIWDKHAS
ncbi:hypothetical protein MTZ49_09785 [Entomomonas sp. E2T0]|uniref:hypothetical protein n=1 Tax=Entomomonas sp. E2T0 TaxID=2930213 RepID=UPI0022282FE7|nr:hypothetical protein [Entomomonas sp. E2T0]UYZ82903.1 hypothetical protein MTZ49_09785 [Entomomonas sp. E2T0]